MITNDQKPPEPILIGKNRMPAPTDVPNKLNIQLVSCLVQRDETVLASDIERSCDIDTVTHYDLIKLGRQYGTSTTKTQKKSDTDHPKITQANNPLSLKNIRYVIY